MYKIAIITFNITSNNYYHCHYYNTLLWGCPTQQRCWILLRDFKMKMDYSLLQFMSLHSHKKSWYQIDTNILNWKQKCIASPPSLSIWLTYFLFLVTSLTILPTFPYQNLIAYWNLERKRGVMACNPYI